MPAASRCRANPTDSSIPSHTRAGSDLQPGSIGQAPSRKAIAPGRNRRCRSLRQARVPRRLATLLWNAAPRAEGTCLLKTMLTNHWKEALTEMLEEVLTEGD